MGDISHEVLVSVLIHLLHFHSLACLVMQRKRSRSSASSGDIACYQAKKMTMVKHAEMYLGLMPIDRESLHLNDPDKVMPLLYANALKRLIQLLEPHLDDAKDAIDTYLCLHPQESVKPSDIDSVKSISELFKQSSVKATWENTNMLQQAVDAIPAIAVERDVAVSILAHYNSHLDYYRSATRLKDVAKGKETESENKGKQVVATTELVPVELTSSKSFNEFTCEDCHLYSKFVT